MPSRTRGALFCALASGAIVLSGLGGCAGDADSDRLKYDAECWMGIRSLHATGVAVTDTESAHVAFDAYLSFLSASPDSFPDDITGLSYISSTFDRTFDERQYRRICYRETRTGTADPYHLCQIRIDQSGRVVYPLGCI